jgi:hypothetical protein
LLIRRSQDYAVERKARYGYYWIVTVSLDPVRQVLEEELEKGEEMAVDFYYC